MTRDRIMGLIAFCAFAAFFGIVVFRIGRVDVAVAGLLGLSLAAYDLWSQLGPRRR